MIRSLILIASVGVLGMGLAGCGSAPDSVGAGDQPAASEAADSAQSSEDLKIKPVKILALGNSIAFGMNPLVTTPQNPASYKGYPDVLAVPGLINVTNAGCPGETSGSFLSASAPDNGCRAWKAAFSLHADYETTQIAFATQFIAQNQDTKFVTIDIGANDLLLVQKGCATATDPVACITAALPGTLTAYGTNLATIFGTLRAVGFTGKFVALNLYATNYADPIVVPAITALNSVTAGVTASFNGAVADSFTGFKLLSQPKNGDVCATGLLIKLPDGTCDIHPSPKGRDVLAALVLAAGVIK